MPTTYDDALIALAGAAPEFGGGFSNHGPMVAAALISLNRPYAIAPWLNEYKHRLEPQQESRGRITRQSWRTALGHIDRHPDWITFFTREAENLGWASVLKEWIPRLTPGLIGAAGHGIIRTAYALDQIRHENNEHRRAELAAGLGYWAARYRKLPGILSHATAPGLSPLEAMARITWRHKGESPPDALISTRLAALDGYPPFTGVINLIGIPVNPERLLEEIVEAMAKTHLAHARVPHTRIAYLHGIIVPSLVRKLLPHVDGEGQLLLVRYGWQLAAAMFAIYGQTNPVDQVEPPDEDLDKLIDAAIHTGDEHAIIGVDACLREYRRNPRPAILAAAWDAVRRLARQTETEATPA